MAWRTGQMSRLFFSRSKVQARLYIQLFNKYYKSSYLVVLFYASGICYSSQSICDPNMSLLFCSEMQKWNWLRLAFSLVGLCQDCQGHWGAVKVSCFQKHWRKCVSIALPTCHVIPWRFAGGEGEDGVSKVYKLPLLIARWCFLWFHGNWRDLSMYTHLTHWTPMFHQQVLTYVHVLNQNCAVFDFEASVFSPRPGLRCTNPEACRGCLKLQVVSRDHKRHCSAMGWSIEEVVLVPKYSKQNRRKKDIRNQSDVVTLLLLRFAWVST